MTRLLLIDNYDSFTYNLLHYCAELNAHVDVVRNDALTIDDITQNAPDGIIISPGPGTPDDSGISCDIIRQCGATIPIFGVCLGHQAIGQMYGASIIRNTPMHGKISPVYHKNKGVFTGVPSPFNATRYHSLVIDPDTMPDCLEVTAYAEDGIIMGVAHKEHPVHGVQFHPESIASDHGHDLLKNFLDIC